MGNIQDIALPKHIAARGKVDSKEYQLATELLAYAYKEHPDVFNKISQEVENLGNDDVKLIINRIGVTEYDVVNNSVTLGISQLSGLSSYNETDGSMFRLDMVRTLIHEMNHAYEAQKHRAEMVDVGKQIIEKLGTLDEETIAQLEEKYHFEHYPADTILMQREYGESRVSDNALLRLVDDLAKPEQVDVEFEDIINTSLSKGVDWQSNLYCPVASIHKESRTVDYAEEQMDNPLQVRGEYSNSFDTQLIQGAVSFHDGSADEFHAKFEEQLEACLKVIRDSDDNADFIRNFKILDELYFKEGIVDGAPEYLFRRNDLQALTEDVDAEINQALESLSEAVKYREEATKDGELGQDERLVYSELRVALSQNIKDVSDNLKSATDEFRAAAASEKAQHSK